MTDPDGMPATAMAATLVAVAVWAVYRAGLNAPFVFDDPIAIVENPTIRHLSRLGEVLRPPPYTAGAAGRPLVNLTLALNYALGGLNVTGYHAANLVFHAATALVLFGLVRRTLRGLGWAPAAAWAAGLTATLVWAVHPLLTESVSSAIQRDEVLGALFTLLTLYGFARHAASETGSRSRRAWAIGCVVSCFVGTGAKETVAAVPLLVFLYDGTFVSSGFVAAWRARRPFYACLAASWALLAGLIVSSHNRGGTVGFGLGASAWRYLLTQAHALALYLKLAAWPHPLVLDYGTDLVSNLGAVWLPGLGVMIVIAWIVWALSRRPVHGRGSALGFLGGAVFCILAPSSSIVPIVTQPVAEHRMYLPLAALVVAAVVPLYRLAGLRSLLVWMVAATALGLLTVRRNLDYLNPATLLRQELDANPANDRAYLNLGTWYDRQGQAAEAIGCYRKALALNGSAADTHYDLAAVLDRAGRPDEAIPEYRRALALRPDYPLAEYGLGLALAKAGRPDEAAAALERALALQPDAGPARRALAAVRAQFGDDAARAGRIEPAVEAYQAAVALEPDDAVAQNNLGNALSALGRHAEAIAHYEAAVRARPDFADAQFNLGQEELASGRLAEARRHLAAAAKLEPGDAEARRELARVEALMRR